MLQDSWLRCRHCGREMAFPLTQRSPLSADSFCVMCLEEVRRIANALLYRSGSILDFIDSALSTKSRRDDDAVITALCDLAETMKGHTIPCDKCKPRRL